MQQLGAVAPAHKDAPGGGFVIKRGAFEYRLIVGMRGCCYSHSHINLCQVLILVRTQVGDVRPSTSGDSDCSSFHLRCDTHDNTRSRTAPTVGGSRPRRSGSSPFRVPTLSPRSPPAPARR